MTEYIVIITGIISVFAFYYPSLTDNWIFQPYKIYHDKQYYRFITSGFLHANWIHLLINMLVLWSFGGAVEARFNAKFGGLGIYYFVLLYLGAIIISDLTSFSKNKNNTYYKSLGASGAVSAVLFSFILFSPLEKFYIYGLLPLPGIVFGVLYLIYSVYSSKNSQENINHDAHFYGAIFGFFYTLMLNPKLFLSFIEQIKSVFY